MAFQYKNITFTNINKDGTALSPTLSFTPATVPAVVDYFAMGNRVRMVLTITRTGPSNWINKNIRVNLSNYAVTGGIGPDFGFETYSPISVVAQTGVFVGGGDGLQLTRQNFSAISFQQVSGIDVDIIIDFYITTDVGQYVSTQYFVNNALRFFVSKYNNFNNILENVGSTVFSTLAALGITVYIKPTSGTQELVVNNTTSQSFWTIPFVTRWYNSGTPNDPGGGYVVDTIQQRWMEVLDIQCPSQVTAGLLPLAHWESPTWLASKTSNIDAMFTVLSQPPVALASYLSPSEKNTVNITLQGYSDSSLTVTAIDDIRVLLVRSDAFFNNILWTDNYDMDEGIVPAVNLGAVQIDGAIWGPNSWAQNLGTGQIDLSFTIDGSYLQNGREYRILVNIYETANPERPTTHVSPPIYAQYVPPALPTIDSYLATYAQEYNATELQEIAPHQRIRARIDIDKASYAAALAAYGFTGTFDGSLDQIQANFIGIPGIVADTVETYRPNTLTLPNSNLILSNGMQIVSDTAGTLSIAATFRVEAERASTTATIRWILRMKQPNYIPGSVTVYEIQFDQTVNIREFENTAGIPTLVGIRFLNPDVYPGIKEDILDICDRDYIICEVEKDNALLSGSVQLIATIYPIDSTDATTNAQIEEEESWSPAVPPLPLLLSGKLDNVDPSFGADDFAIFRINTQQLTQGQRYRVSAIAIDQTPDYCPIGLVQQTIIETYRTGTTVPGWVVVGDPNPVIAEILAHPDYVGGLSVIYNRVVDEFGNLQSASQYITGDVVTSPLINYFAPSLTEVYYELRIDAQFDPGTGPHLVSHVLRVLVPIPAIGPSIFYNSNAYVCTDLG